MPGTFHVAPPPVRGGTEAWVALEMSGVPVASTQPSGAQLEHGEPPSVADIVCPLLVLQNTIMYSNNKKLMRLEFEKRVEFSIILSKLIYNLLIKGKSIKHFVD